jgi:NADPH:quinone reductase-like Zn-dependent oxidoreductase
MSGYLPRHPMEYGQTLRPLALGTGALRPVIDRIFVFDEMVEAQRNLESNRQFGKVIVTV